MGGKKIKGHKRHISVDTLGNLLYVKVHAANKSDTRLLRADSGGRAIQVLISPIFQFRHIIIDFIKLGEPNG